MMPAEALLSIGIGALSLLVTVIFYVMSSYKSRIKELEDENKALSIELKEVRKDYVRRDDMRSELAAVTKSMDEIKDGMKQLLGLVIAAGKYNPK